MKNKKFRVLSCMLTAVLVAGSLMAGCGQSRDAVTDSETPQETADSGEQSALSTPETQGSGEEATITVNTQASVGAQEAWQAVADAYMEKNPNVKVVVDLKPSEGYAEWVQNIFTIDDPTSDIVNVNLAGTASSGKVINFLEYADMDSPYSDGSWSEQFNFQMQTKERGQSEWSMLSLDSVQVVWCYNKEIFEEVGVEPPTTWDELVTVCEKLEAAGYQPITMPGDSASFWSGTFGWLAQIYTDQTTRSMLDIYRAHEGDYCFDPETDGVWKYDPTDPFNDDAWKVNQNAVRAYKAVKENVYSPSSPGMKTVWENFAKIFPKYAGGETFFGTIDPGQVSMFYQGKAAMMVDGAWRLVNFNNDMKKLSSGESVTDAAGTAIEGVKKFDLGVFNMPSMEGEGIEAPARTIEVATGFVGAVAKDKAHDDQVVDFLMYYSSQEGQSIYLSAGIEAGLVPQGPSLVYGVELPADIQAMFDQLELIGNCQKGCAAWLARGMSDVQESVRDFYRYSYDYLTGKITIDDWLTSHQKNIDTYIVDAMASSEVSESDLENPQNEPTGE